MSKAPNRTPADFPELKREHLMAMMGLIHDLADAKRNKLKSDRHG